MGMAKACLLGGVRFCLRDIIHKLRIFRSSVGSLLDVPTHTVNMTTLRSSQDLWKSYSMSPYEVKSSA